MPQLWYHSDGKQVFGPISADELRRLAANGTIRPDTHVCSEPDRRWTLASTVAELFRGAKAPEPHAPPVTSGPAPVNAPPPAHGAPPAASLQAGGAASQTASPFHGAEPAFSATPAAYDPSPRPSDDGPIGGILDLTFRRFAVTKIVIAIWIACLLAALLALLGALAAAVMLIRTSEDMLQGLFLAIVWLGASTVGISLALLYARVLLEVIVVLFRIAEHLEEINAKTPGAERLFKT